MPSRLLSPLVCGSLLLLIVIGAVLDPVGFFALYGMPGRVVPVTRWQAAPLVVQMPLLLAGVWVVTTAFRQLGRWRRFASIWGGIVLVSLVAKFAMTVVATAPWSGAADLAWATGYTVPKAALYGLVAAGTSLLVRGPGAVPRTVAGTPWASAAGVAVLAGVSGSWLGQAWGRDLPHAVPTVSPSGGVLGLAAGLLVLFLAAARTQRTFARRSGGPLGDFLGGWIATLWAGAVLGLVQAVAMVLVDGVGSALQTPALLYVRVCEGVAFGAAIGWAAGLGALYTARRRRDPLPVGAGTRRAAVTVALAVTGGAVLGSAGEAEPPVLSGGASAATPGDELLPLHAVRGEHPRIADAAGRQVLLRGVNVNQLVDFYAPRPEVPATRPLTEADFASMAGLGFDVVRLGLSWSKIEPSPGSYDQTYLARADQAVVWARAHGLYTVLDLHQDGWNNQPTPPGTSCPAGTSAMDGYDGAPVWATHADGAVRCQFTGRDLSPAGDRAFTNFSYDRDGVQTRLVKVWGMLAARYGDDPSIAGFDPMNEPGFGEQAPITSTLLLGRFYDRVLKEIRSTETRRHLFFFEPSIFWSGLGFDAIPRGSFTDDPDLVFAPHLYGESITMDASLGLPPDHHDRTRLHPRRTGRQGHSDLERRMGLLG
ncbi:glycoside hydrolase family 5 protein [Actinocorallia longicatena]|uniref:Glycoside hydrolase family 5 domain-containing protein n=1 Tax=Actinocorallia longicatena TaxID=111803 RepID=A0ABP6Q9R3_9ACTN